MNFSKFRNFIFPIERIVYIEYSGRKNKFSAIPQNDYEYGTNVYVLTENGMTTCIHVSDKDITDEFLKWLHENKTFEACIAEKLDLSKWQTPAFNNGNISIIEPCVNYVEAVQDENGIWKTIISKEPVKSPKGNTRQ